jgi:hypothetical protein
MRVLAYFGIESTGVTLAIDLLIAFGVLLYFALIYWTYIDARRRIVDPTLVSFATVVSIIPFIGTLLYVIVRPPETLEDARERELDVETTRLRLHQLESALCPHCDYPVDPDYVRCPSCLRKLKERCKSCSRPLDRAWTICPYCETEVPARGSQSRRGAARRRAASRPALERELASDHAGAASDGRETPVPPESASAQRRRAVAAKEEREQDGAGRRTRSRPPAPKDAPKDDGRRPDSDAGEPAPAPRPRTERSRPASAPRPGSAY